MSLDYARQKSREALDSLTSSSGLVPRLGGAGWALMCFPTEGLPLEVAVQAKVAERAFTSWPSSMPVGEDGTIEQLLRMLPEQRLRELVSKVVSLHEELCVLEGRGGQQSRQEEGAGRDVEPTGADKWEFLYWQLTHSDSAKLKEAYVQYAQGFLPNFPAKALLEWLGRHGYASMRRWGFLPLERLEFKEETWSLSQLRTVRAYDEAFTAIGEGSQGEHHVNRGGDWTAEFIRENGTWSAPILVLAHSDDLRVDARVTLPPGFTLIEGHTRISRILNMPEHERNEQGHRVIVMKLPTSS